MQNIRMIPPVSGPFLTDTCVAYGRPYSPAVSYADVPENDALVLESNGWMRSPGHVGPTSARPVVSDLGAQVLRATIFLDTTVGAFIQWNGTAWINLLTGSVA